MKPSISIIIPTYNSSATLKLCLESIRAQEYYGDLEIIIVDAGSTDSTFEITKQYKVDKILFNKLKTGEAGKAVGVKEAKNEIIALIDSDNILDGKDWLAKMVQPFKDKEIVGSEPLYYTYRREDGYITRYCALIGMNDPICLFFGNYDRFNLITNKWTEMPVKQEDFGNYLKIELDEKKLPTIGANGFLVRRDDLLKGSVDDYLFDIDVVYELIKQNKNKFAKVKIGIIHIFSGDLDTFFIKTKRRIKDYIYYNKLNLRKYPWNKLNKIGLIKFILYTVLTIPLIIQSIIGYSRKQDKVWLMHPLFCWITLIIYASGKIKGWFKVEEMDRSKWQK